MDLVTSIFTQPLVLQVASSTESTFSEVFISVETDQNLADQVLDYLL